MRIISYCTLSLCILLCGCRVGPDFEKPAAPKTKSYTQKDDNLVTPQQRVVLGKQLTAEWWTLFNSPALNKTIRQALNGNYDLVVAKKTLQQAEEAVKSQAGALWPQIDLDAIAGRQKYGVALFGPTNFKIPPFTYYEVGPTGSWLIDIFGGTRASIEQQQALAEYQMHNLDAAYILLTSNVVAQALEIATIKAQIVATKRIIYEDEKTLNLLKKAFTIGSGTKVSVLSAQSHLDNDRALLPPLQQNLEVAKHALAILVGKAPADWIAPDFELKDFTLPGELPLALPSELVRQRPDILAAEANLHAACAAVGVATANLYPSLVLDATLFQEALTPHALFLGVSNAWSMAAGLTAPLFYGGTLRAEKHKMEYGYQAALAQYKQTILVAFNQVANALTSLAHDNARVAIQEEALTTSTASLDLAYKSFKAGASGLLQVQDAQREFARAQINLIRAQRERYLDTAQLFVALGGSPVKDRMTLNEPCAPIKTK